MKKNTLAVAVFLIALPFLLLHYLPAWAADCREPPFITSGGQSNVLVILDNSGSMQELAYKEAQGTISSAGLSESWSSTSSQCSGQPNCPTWNNTSRTTCQSHYCTDTWSINRTVAWGDTYSFTCTFAYDCRWTSSGRRCNRRLASKACACTDPDAVTCPETWGWSSPTGNTSTNSQVNMTVTEPSSGIHPTAYYGYIPTKRYYGLFDPDKTYKYKKESGGKYFEVAGNVVDPNGTGLRAASTSASDQTFSGNWLNWLTSRRIDVAKKVLTGGRLGGDPTEYVLIGTPTNRDYYKMFNDNGADGVYYTPFHQGFLVQFYNSLDLAQRTANGNFVPLFVFFRATFSSASQAVITGSLEDANLGAKSEYGNLGEPDYSGSTRVKEYPGSYYFAVKHSLVADNNPPAGIVQNMSSKVRLGLMHFNYGTGPAEGQSMGNRAVSWDINGDGTTDYAENYGDGGRVLHRVGDASQITSWQSKSIYTMVQSINEMMAVAWTPLAETMREAMNYFRQNEPTYAWVDSTGTLQKNFYRPADGAAYKEWDPYYYLKPDGTDSLEPCRKSYIVLVTDGEPTQDSPCKSDCKTIGDTTCTNDCTAVSKTFRFNGATYLDDIAYKLYTEDNRTDIGSAANPPEKQTVSTYTIFCFDESPVGKELLQRTAIAGGFTDLNTDDQPGKPYSGSPAPCTTTGEGSCSTWKDSYNFSNWDGYYEWDADANANPDHYFEAQDGYQLEAQIQSIFSQVALGGAAGAVATISQQTKEGDAIIRGAFDAVDPNNRSRYLWNGRLEVYWPDVNGEYQFDLSDNFGLFCSQMKQLLVDAKGNTPCCWDAGEKLKGLSQGDRQTAKIFTYVPSLAAGNRQQDFTVANWLYFQSLMRKSGTDCSEANFKDCVLGDYEVKALIQWTRGVVDDQAYPVGNTANPPSGRWGGDPAEGPYRDRQGYLLGDIVYSTPVIVGPPPIASVTSADSNLVTSVSGATVDYSDGAQAFWDFRNYWVENPSGTTYQGRPKVAYVGANDGMLHAFLIARLRKDTDEWDYNCPAEAPYPAAGSKLWSYIPSNLLGELYSLSRTNYGVECKHRTMVDLSPRAWDVFIKSDDCSACVTPPCPYPNARPSGCSDRCWRTIIIGGERGGGDTYFSVDVTDPLAPKVLWEYSALKNLAVPYDDAGSTKLALPFREKDDSTDTGLCPSDKWPDLSTGWPNSCFDSMYFKLKTLPMSWTRAVLGRVRIPHDVGFWRYVESTSAAADVFRDPPWPTLEKKDTFGPCDNKRHIAFIGTAFQSFDDPSTSPVPSPSPFPDTVKSALVKPYLLALDVETGENYFQVLWPLAMKARTDAGLLPDRDSADTRTQGLIPWAFGNPTLVDVWDNQDQEMTDTYPAPATADRFAEDGYVDRLYMGDMRGFLYRMTLNLKGNATHKGMNVEFWPTKPLPSDLTPTNPATCDQTNGYRGCRQPITVAPAISYELGSTATDWPKLRVLFGTGKFDKVVGTGGDGDDKTDKTKMSFYNLLDDLRSFNCMTVSGAKVCDGLPTIAPNASFGIVDPDVYPAGVSATGGDPEKGFLMTGTNFGLTFGEGTCPNDRDTTTTYNHLRSCGPDTGAEATTGCDSTTLTRVCGQTTDPGYAECATNCTMLMNRDVCCNWVKDGGSDPDCCQMGSDCKTDVCSGTPEKCTPCWNCIYDFGTPGERVIGDPLIAFGLVYFTTYIPETTECSAGGHGWLYVLDYRCLPLESGFNPITNPFARTIVQTGRSGARVDLGQGMPSEPVMDSTGQFVFVQKSDATVVKIGVPGGPDDGGGGSSFKDVQFKGWNRK